MIKFKHTSRIFPTETDAYLFFTFSDKSEIKKSLRNAEEILKEKFPKKFHDSVMANSENQNLSFLKDGRLLFFQKCDKLERLNPDIFRRASASAVKKLISMKLNRVTLVISTIEKESLQKNFDSHEYYLQTFLEGLALGSYKYDQYLSEKSKAKIDFHIFYPELSKRKIDAVIKLSNVITKYVMLARDLQNSPASELYPETLALKVKSLSKQNPKVKVKVFNLTEIKKRKMRGLEAVGKGSERKPQFIILEYFGKDRKSQPLVIVGKGVTFDSGGISIKPAQNMWEMKGDMSGAATTIATIFTAAELKLKINLVGLIPAAENMPSGSSMRPGDIIRTASGKSIEIDNTDAEGRLILADALEYAAKYKPKLVIDLATLTGACVVALGNFASGLFTRDDDLSREIVRASNLTGERVWRLPLWDDYHQLIKSDIADVKNVGGRWGGAITAACFLEKFVDKKYKWAHLDIAGPAFAEETIPYTSKTMTGYGVRLLIKFLENT